MSSSQVAAGCRISCYKTHEKHKNVLYFYVQEEEKWHRMVHKRGGSIEENVQETVDTISEGSEMYLVEADGEKAGFFVKYQSEKGVALEGFHVAKKFRNAAFLKSFWELIKEKLGDDFKTGICSRNKQAIKHLLKQGFIVEGEKLYDGKIFIILKLKP